MLGMFQQMQNDGARREQLLLAQIEALKPRPAPVAPIDPFADLPEKFNTPEIKEFLKVAQDKILSPYQKQMEARIQEAQHTRLTNQYASEAEQAAQAVISSGYDLSGQDAAIVKDGLRDFALTLSHVHGGTPSQYKDALARVADSLGFLTAEAEFFPLCVNIASRNIFGHRGTAKADCDNGCRNWRYRAHGRLLQGETRRSVPNFWGELGQESIIFCRDTLLSRTLIVAYPRDIS